jgi:hypothetical protein
MENNIGIESLVKSFAMSNFMLQEDLLHIQRDLNIDLGVEKNEDTKIEDDYYPQFDLLYRSQAKQMSKYYELFFCLEKTIRKLVSESLEEIEETNEWWNTARIPEGIKNGVGDRIKKEIDSAVTKRSNDELDYTTFGELSEIIISNWDIFGSIFNSQKAVQKVMTSLNTLRGPIAHCSILSEDEVLRLKLNIRDWFRLME